MRRSLSRFDVTCLGVNAIIGSGIFALPDDLARLAGPWSPVAFLLCALGLAPIALCYAEAAGRTERTGGPYVYAREAFGPAVGFAVGWMCLANAVLSFGAVASIAGAYLARLGPPVAGAIPARAAAVGVVAAFAALNWVGARPSARVTDLFTVAKVAALAVLVLVALPHLRASAFEAPPPALAGLGGATFLAVFAAQGFEVAPVPAGETAAARRTVPFAILASLGLSSLIYVAVQATVVGVHPGLTAESDAPLAEAARAVAPWLGSLVGAAGVVSALGFVSGTALGTPRYAWAAAADGTLPRRLAAVHPRFGTPHVAIAVTGALAALLAATLDFRRLAGMSNVTVAVQYLATCVAVLALRRRGAGTGFRAPGGPLAPLAGVAVSAWIFTQGSAGEMVVAGAALGLGALVFALTRWADARGRRGGTQ
jgi:amino acid transporter